MVSWWSGFSSAFAALLNTYFDQIASAEESRKFGQVVPQALLNLRADEEQRLTGGPMPVDKAMQAIVARGRMGASPDIMPSASRDLAPMQGWSKMPVEVPPAMMAPPPETRRRGRARRGRRRRRRRAPDGPTRGTDGGVPRKPRRSSREIPRPVPPSAVVLGPGGAVVPRLGAGLDGVEGRARAGVPRRERRDAEHAGHGAPGRRHRRAPGRRAARATPRFATPTGNAVHLGDYFDGKRPTLLVFAYHTCPMLCSLVLDATVRSLNEVAWTVGKEFDVVSISIDPHDTPETATRKRGAGRRVVSARRAATTVGWHFLVGDEANIRKVTDAIGFEYRYDARQKQYAHPAAIYLLTPEGHIARYLYGIQYEPKDVRLGLLEATEGRSVSTTDRILLFCYHYDPQGKHYAIVAMNVMRLGGVVTLGVLGTFLTIMWARERGRRKDRAAPPANDSANLREPPNTSVA